MSSLSIALFFYFGDDFMRKFELISVEQFNKDVVDSKYEDLKLPFRKTKMSAGYDFISFLDIVINPGEAVKIPTGVKVMLNDGEFLAIFVRSSMGFKYNVRMCNQVGIIDSDYYNNIDNEGHIWIKLQNEGDKDYIIKKGDAFAQGIIMKYYLCDDDNVLSERIGGIGSTDRRDNNE